MCLVGWIGDGSIVTTQRPNLSNPRVVEGEERGGGENHGRERDSEGFKVVCSRWLGSVWGGGPRWGRKGVKEKGERGKGEKKKKRKLKDVVDPEPRVPYKPDSTFSWCIPKLFSILRLKLEEWKFTGWSTEFRSPRWRNLDSFLVGHRLPPPICFSSNEIAICLALLGLDPAPTRDRPKGLHLRPRGMRTVWVSMIMSGDWVISRANERFKNISNQDQKEEQGRRIITSLKTEYKEEMMGPAQTQPSRMGNAEKLRSVAPTQLVAVWMVNRTLITRYTSLPNPQSSSHSPGIGRCDAANQLGPRDSWNAHPGSFPTRVE
ncbi:uncharacterized protein N7496_011789 [Penicillium cataractarum]|uniref:Uncharacterized protein n=1 Tax=Penicillium cataractarum TaxID=2100454 RepID=A0A9W9RFW8_9EURO|nr:uncharacterized protein N7496_011789 [Penicillium cataractarum]KAJ5359376.1 hypothetical protein N7496_011789 [Penicillium cataractarum]